MNESVKVERHIYIGASAGKVWEAITTPEIASEYFIAPLIELEPHPGGTILYGTDGRELMRGTVTEYEPGRKLVHTFALPTMPDDPPSRVTYLVEPIGEMCRLTMIHDGFPSRNGTFESVNGGWDAILCDMKSLMETGRIMPWPEKETM